MTITFVRCLKRKAAVSGRAQDKVPVDGQKGDLQVITPGCGLVGLAGELGDQFFFHAKYRVFMQVRAIGGEDMGDNLIEARRRDDKVQVRGAVEHLRAGGVAVQEVTVEI